MDITQIEKNLSKLIKNLNEETFIYDLLSYLEIDVFDEKGIRHTPREWFIVPIEAIERAIALIISGEIVNYRYDKEEEKILQITS
jgi:hypothetical protein